jgi:hypothetical protein
MRRFTITYQWRGQLYELEGCQFSDGSIAYLDKRNQRRGHGYETPHDTLTLYDGPAPIIAWIDE